MTAALVGLIGVIVGGLLGGTPPTWSSDASAPPPLAPPDS
jgi:hypothetical protein